MMSNPNEASGNSLLVRGECGSRLMYPASCTEHGKSHWNVERRCPDHDAIRANVFEVAMLDARDQELNCAEAAI
jgi:hypothetical protein